MSTTIDSQATSVPAASTIRADYGYQTETGLGFTRFMVTPPPMGIGTRAGLSLLKVTVTLVCATAAGVLFEFVIGKGGLLVLLGVAFGLWRMYAKGQRVVEQTLQSTRITVSSEGINKDGAMYARPDILGIQVLEPPAPAQGTTTTTTFHQGSGMSGAIGAVGASAQAWGTQVGGAMGDAFAAHVNRRAFGVNMRYGAKDIALVALVPEGTARALAEQIVTALDTHH
jgi:hypothetical protein